MRRLIVLAAALVTLTGAAPGLERPGAYPEGPLIDGARILVAEMGADRISMFENGAWRAFWTEPGCGPTSVAPYGSGYAVTCHIGRSVALLTADGALAGRVLDETGGQPNDSSADDAGGVYLSSPGAFTSRRRIEGRILRLDADGRLATVASDLHYPNGVYFDRKARALYVSEHLARRIWRFPVASDGRLGPRTLYAAIDAVAPPAKLSPAFPEAGPDGLERAPNGDMVVALYGEGRLLQITPRGDLRRVIPAPVRYVTNLAFLPDGSAVVVGARDVFDPTSPGAIATLPASAFEP